MNDESLMPWGKYKGEKIANVPPEYLLWLVENNKCSGEVKKYIQENQKTLIAEIALNKKMRGY
jgi:uncharacterized protein (DUF3820 family)